VVEIRVIGNRRIEADAVRGRIATRVGEPYDAQLVRDDLRRVFELGFFRDVQVLASDRPTATTRSGATRSRSNSR
jgi:outer membrane protein insertion porin family